ncbi:MAG: carbamoyl phosphate synthase large subunit, partial [Senegalimassilia anaerobia]
FDKTQLAISYKLPEGGTVFVSVCDRDKRGIVPIARDFVRLGFHIVATEGTSRALRAAGVDCTPVKKISEGEPNVLDMLIAGDIALMINTPFGHATRDDGYELRTEAVKHGVTQITTLAGAQAMAAGLEAMRANGLSAIALQDLPQHPLPLEGGSAR